MKALALSAILMTALAVLQVYAKPFPQREVESNSNSQFDHVNNGRQSNKLEDIEAQAKKDRAQIPLSLIISGLKRLSANVHEVDKMATTEERDQMERDLSRVVEKLISDPAAWEIFTQFTTLTLNKLRVQDGLKDEQTEQIDTKRTAAIQKLDKIFANEPAWGRYWRYFSNNLTRYMQVYG